MSNLKDQFKKLIIGTLFSFSGISSVGGMLVLSYAFVILGWILLSIHFKSNE